MRTLFVEWCDDLLQISSNHPLLHQKVLDLLTRLFESSFEELDVLVQVITYSSVQTGT